MIKFKNTKRALLGSALALLVCISMLIGSTFAWFTDSVTSSGNKIKAGKLDIQLLMDADVDGDYDDISANTAPIFGTENALATANNADTLWEPGKTQVAYLAIKNNGNLALKYTVGLNVENVSKDLYKVMKYAIVADADANNKVTAWNGGNGVVVGTQSVSDDVSLAVGATHYFALAIHMDETAGNEYQEGEVAFDLTVLATQDTVEEDSFNNQYDKNATYPVVSAAELAEAFANGGNIALAADINTPDETVYAYVDGTVVDLSGNKISAQNITSLKDATFSNGTITLPADGQVYAQDGANITLEDVVIDSDDLSVYSYTGGTIALKDVTIQNTSTSNPVQNYGGTLILDNVSVVQEGDANSAWYSSAIQVINQITIDSVTGKWKTVSQANTTIENGNYKGKKTIMISAPGGNVTINGGTFVGTEAVIQADFAPQNYIDGSNYESVVTINGGKFTGKIKASKAAKIYINGGEFDVSFDVKAETELVIKGGTFTVDPTAYLADGYVATENNGIWTVAAQ